MKGKDKCRILKEIRAQIAAANHIEWVTDNCAHKGDCRGTCPKCEAEVAKLERELARRRALGKTVAVAGLAAGMVFSITSCDEIPQPQTNTTHKSENVIQTVRTTDLGVLGDMEPVYFYTDFTLCTPRTYEATKAFYAERVLVGDDDPYDDIHQISSGESFEVVGETDYLLMIRYQDGYFYVDQSRLADCAREIVSTAETKAEVTADTTVPTTDSDIPTP